VTSYGVNGFGQRVTKTVPTGALIEYAYDLSGRLLGSYDASGAAREEIVWLGDLPVATVQGGVAYAIAPDHLGAPHQIVNASNQQVWFWDHDPFGQGLPVAAAGFSHDLRFPGQIFDVETGLHHNGYRDYDPRLGRYVESDPIGLAGGINTYAYAGNDPVSLIDPSGRFPLLPVIVAAAVLYSGGANAPGACDKIVPSSDMAPYLAIVSAGVGGLFGRAGLGTAKGLVAGAKGGKGYVDGFRAVSKKEADDIAKHGFRPEPSGRSMNDKWFSETRQGAEQFSKTYLELESVVHTRVPRDVYDRSFMHPNIDNTGPGFCVQCSDLKFLPKP
jgi:RHS repeat-associated protein